MNPESALVTGASSGIGRAICGVLIELGYQVFGLGRTFCKEDLKDGFVPLVCDIANHDQLNRTVAEIRRKADIHILVNNAGLGFFGPHEELNGQKIHQMVAVNLEAPMILTQLLLRDLKKNQGTVLQISSVTAKDPSPRGSAYGATKAGLSHFSESLFQEVRKYGVKVITIHPDMTQSSFYRSADFTCVPDEAYSLQPEEIGAAVRMILTQQPGTVITDLVIRPQKHGIQRKP